MSKKKKIFQHTLFSFFLNTRFLWQAHLGGETPRSTGKGWEEFTSMCDHHRLVMQHQCLDILGDP